MTVAVLAVPAGSNAWKLTVTVFTAEVPPVTDTYRRWRRAAHNLGAGRGAVEGASGFGGSRAGATDGAVARDRAGRSAAVSIGTRASLPGILSVVVPVVAQRVNAGTCRAAVAATATTSAAGLSPQVGRASIGHSVDAPAWSAACDQARADASAALKVALGRITAAHFAASTR